MLSDLRAGLRSRGRASRGLASPRGVRLAESPPAAALLAISKLGTTYYVIPAVIADKIRERNDQYIAAQVDVSTLNAPAEDDPYADYQIPDDLMW